MRTRSLIAAALCGVTILGWTVGHGSGPAVAARECPADVGAANHAIGVDAVYQGGLVGTASSADARQPSSVVARQVATSAGRNGIRRGSAGCGRDRRLDAARHARVAPDRRGVPPHVVGPRCGGLGRRRQARRALRVGGADDRGAAARRDRVRAGVRRTCHRRRGLGSADGGRAGGCMVRRPLAPPGRPMAPAHRVRRGHRPVDGGPDAVPRCRRFGGVRRRPRARIAGRAAAVLAVAAARWRGASRHAARR